jgi:hypothetical protein
VLPRKLMAEDCIRQSRDCCSCEEEESELGFLDMVLINCADGRVAHITGLDGIGTKAQGY